MNILNYDGLRAKGVPFTRLHLWRLVRAHKFPAPIKLAGTAASHNFWVEEEIDQYLAQRVAERDAQQGPPVDVDAPKVKGGRNGR